MEPENIYTPISKMQSLGTQVPENMLNDMNNALFHLAQAVGNVDDYVCRKLKMTTDELSFTLAAEQVDGVALAIYNIEVRNQGLIIGDMTGLGKGRQAASIIRYAALNGYFPIFFTAKVNLFSDLYRDMKAVGSQDLCPLILNTGGVMVDYGMRTKFTDVDDVDEVVLSDFKKVYKSDALFIKRLKNEDSKILAEYVMDNYNYVVSTYSQLNKGINNEKFQLLKEIVSTGKAIFVLDESHEAAGESNTSQAIGNLIAESKGCVYLSATFAKRAENLQLYSAKTALNNAGLDGKKLAMALANGGLPLQEMISSQLVHHGQMIRREKDYNDIDVQYEIYQHSASRDIVRYDRVAQTIQDIQEYHCTKGAEAFKKFKEQAETYVSAMGTTSNPVSLKGKLQSPHEFSYVPSTLDALSLAIKIENIAAEVVRLVKDGNKVVVAISKTAGTALRQLLNQEGEIAKVGDMVDASFSNVLLAALHRTHHVDGMKEEDQELIKSLLDKDGCFGATPEYTALYDKIKATDYELPVSPIDVLLKVLRQNDIKVGECTGRSLCIDYSDEGYKGHMALRKREPVDWLYNEFQNNRIDVMITNATGSTGASAHAVPTASVPESEVKRRVMIVAQPELNVNTEIQKRGRINRIGQLQHLPPKYIYVSSVVPHERRTLMMLKKKLKSLDANTSSCQYQNNSMLDCSDICNKYGDDIVREWLDDNPMEDMLLMNPRGDSGENIKELAMRTTGRVGILSCADQERFYSEVIESYENKVQLLVDDDDFDLETLKKDFQAVRLEYDVMVKGDNKLPLGGDAFIGKYECKVHRRPYSYQEVADNIALSYPDFDPSRPDTYRNWHGEWQMINKFYEKLIDETWITTDDEDKRDRIERRIRENKSNISDVLAFFHLGRYVNMELEGEMCPAIVTGIKLGKNLTPGQVSVEFAVAHYTRTRTYNCVSRKNSSGLVSDCGMFRLLQIMFNSERDSRKALMGVHQKDWEYETKKKMEGVVKKYIVTGNIVRSYISDSMSSGRHIVFSDMNGLYHHGVLLSNESIKKTHADANCLMIVSEAVDIIINQGFVSARFPITGLPDYAGLTYDGWYKNPNCVFLFRGAKNVIHLKALRDLLNEYAKMNELKSSDHFMFQDKESIKVYLGSPCIKVVVDYLLQFKCNVLMPKRYTSFLTEDASEVESWPIAES